jgi:hypothetical protein
LKICHFAIGWLGFLSLRLWGFASLRLKTAAEFNAKPQRSKDAMNFVENEGFSCSR